MNKRDLNERDICSKFITPAILSAVWELTTQIRDEVRATKRRIIDLVQRLSRGKEKRADLRPWTLRPVTKPTGPSAELKAIIAKIAQRLDLGASRAR